MFLYILRALCSMRLCGERRNRNDHRITFLSIYGFWFKWEIVCRVGNVHTFPTAFHTQWTINACAFCSSSPRRKHQYFSLVPGAPPAQGEHEFYISRGKKQFTEKAERVTFWIYSYCYFPFLSSITLCWIISVLPAPRGKFLALTFGSFRNVD